MRVLHPESPEELHQLPDVYFIEAYKLAEGSTIGSKILADAKAIEKGQYERVDWTAYMGESGERRLHKLLTVIPFLSDEGNHQDGDDGMGRSEVD